MKRVSIAAILIILAGCAEEPAPEVEQVEAPLSISLGIGAQCYLLGACVFGLCVIIGDKPAGTACDDGNSCTQTDACNGAGACVGSNPVTCTAGACQVAGVCNPANGTCSTTNRPNGTTCSDGNACTTGDTCQAGACVAGAPVTCTAANACQIAGVCNPTTGACSSTNRPNGTTCSDANACTIGDSCQAGACVAGAPVTCTAQNACQLPGSCNTSTGACSYPNKPNGTSCSDNNACTNGDSCQAGTCLAGAAVTCTAADACHAAGSCDPSTGSCSDGGPLTGASSCCRHYQMKDANDVNLVECTAGSEYNNCDASQPYGFQWTDSGVGTIESVSITLNPGLSCDVTGTRTATLNGAPTTPPTFALAPDPNGAQCACPATQIGAVTLTAPVADYQEGGSNTVLIDGATSCEGLQAPAGSDAYATVEVCYDTPQDQCAGVVCAPHGPCDVGTCDPNSGACVYTITVGASCDGFGSPCVAHACNAAGSCKITGSAPAGTACEDGDQCSTGDQCDGQGDCLGGTGTIFSGGTGTTADPYLVSTRADLDHVRLCDQRSFLQTANVDVSGCNSFTPIPQLRGSYDGAGKIISNFCYQDPNAFNIALFGDVSGAIRNVNATNFTILAGTYMAGLVVSLTGSLTNSTISGSVTSGKATASTHGGMVGSSYGQIVSCSSSVDVTANQPGNDGIVGGLVGVSSGLITGSTATGNVIGSSYCIGGLAGMAGDGGTPSLIVGSSAHGSVTGSINVGGLVGCSFQGTVQSSYANGDVTGNASVGGLVGAMEVGTNLVQNSHATGNVNGSNGYFYGGLVGGGNFYGPGGCATGRIEHSYATGNVNGWYYFVGGLVGASCLDIVDSYALGDVTGGAPTGGLVGATFGTNTPAYGYWGVAPGTSSSIVGSFAGGNVSGASGLSPYSGFPGGTGGLVGASWSSVDNSYAYGHVDGLGDSQPGFAGGLAGVNLGSIHNSYSGSPWVAIRDALSQPVPGAAGVFAVVGANAIDAVSEPSVGWSLVAPGSTPDPSWQRVTLTGTVSGAYYLAGTGAPADSLATGLTPAQMSSSSSFVGYDFSTPDWVIPTAHPLPPIMCPALAWECGSNGVTCP